MNKTELINILKACEVGHETESGHIKADQALIEFINDADIKEAYEDVSKWYS